MCLPCRRHPQPPGAFKHEGQAECTGHRTVLPTQLQKQIWTDFFYSCMAVCSAVTHMLRALQIFSAQSNDLSHVCTKIPSENVWLRLGCLLLPFTTKTEEKKKIALKRNILSEFGSRSQRKQLKSSREQKPSSEKRRKKQPQTSKNRKSSRKFPYRDLICYCTQILALRVKIYKKLSSLIHHLLPTVL